MTHHPNLPDGDYLIRIIVTDAENGEHPQFVRCQIKDGIIPSTETVINYLSKRENYPKDTKYYTKGISAMVDFDYDRFPDFMEQDQ